jgi:hypothetical protein
VREWGAEIAMTHYRVYTLGDHERVSSPPEIIECPDDRAAIDRAKQLLDGHTIEVWDGLRRVIRLRPKDRPT